MKTRNLKEIESEFNESIISNLIEGNFKVEDRIDDVYVINIYGIDMKIHLKESSVLVTLRGVKIINLNESDTRIHEIKDSFYRYNSNRLRFKVVNYKELIGKPIKLKELVI